MRRSILMMLLAVVSASAVAEWVKVSGDETKTVYVDPATIHMAGNKVEMWVLHDYKNEQFGSKDINFRALVVFMSERRQVEYDCQEGQVRTRRFVFHRKHMGEEGGIDIETYYKNREGKEEAIYPRLSRWTPVPPGAIAEDLWKVACGKQ